jgi:hypothetical protein
VFVPDSGRVRPGRRPHPAALLAPAQAEVLAERLDDLEIARPCSSATTSVARSRSTCSSTAPISSAPAAGDDAFPTPDPVPFSVTWPVGPLMAGRVRRPCALMAQ